MQKKLKTIQAEQCKGKSAGRISAAADELHYLMDFNSSISQAMAYTMEHLSDFVFVSMANLTLTRSYLSHMKTDIKPNILAAVRTAPLQMTTLFPDSVLKQAEEDIVSFESKGHSHASLSDKKTVFSTTLMKGRRSVQITNLISKPGRSSRARPPTTHRQQPMVSCPINDNYCVNAPVYTGELTRSKRTVNVCQYPETLKSSKQTVTSCQFKQTLNVNSTVVTHALIVKGQPQKA